MSEAQKPILTILTHYIRVYSILIHTGKGEGRGELNQREGSGWGATVHKAGSKLPG